MIPCGVVLKPKIVFLSINGVRLKILLRRGSNPNIILLHGMPSQMSNWKHVLGFLETKNYSVIVPIQNKNICTDTKVLDYKGKEVMPELA